MPASLEGKVPGDLSPELVPVFPVPRMVASVGLVVLRKVGIEGWSDMANKYSVTLAPVTEDDYSLLAQWTSSGTGVYASGIQHYASAAQFKDFISRAPDRYLIACTTEGLAIGMVSWQPTDTPGNYSVGAMIGDPDMWGAGFGSEATNLLVRILFDSKRAHRVEFVCGTFNLRAVEGICAGLITVEGILRDYYFVDGEYYDAIVGSVLRDEYDVLKSEYDAGGNSPGFIPEGEKDAARKIVADFLEKNPIVLRDRFNG